MSKDVTFPLPRDYFPQMELTEKEERKYETWGESLLQETIDAYHRDQFLTPEQKDDKWKILKQRGDLVAYRRRDTSNEHNSRYLLTGTVNGTLDEILFGRYADNTDDYRRVSSIYRDDLVDCAIVHVIKKRTPENPFYFSGFKWMTVQSPGKGLVKNRDVCWYEQTGFTMDHHGKEIGYSIAESVELPTCPPFQKCVRARVSVCFLYRQTKNGTLKVYMRGKNKAGGRVIDWVTDLKSAELWLRTEELITCAHAKIASDLVAATEAKKHGTFSHRHHQKSTSERCDVCREKKTGVFATLSDCAVCKNGACSRCCIKKRVLGPANNFKQIRKEVFCKKCVQLIHDAPLRDLNATESLHRLALRCISNESSFSSSFISQRSMLSSSASSTKGSPKNSTSLRSPRTRGSAPRSHRSSSDQQPRSERNGYHYHSQRYSHQNQPNHKPLPASSTIISSSAPVPLVLYEVDEIHEGHLGNVLSKNASSDYTNSTGIVTSELSYNENSCPNSQVTTSLEIPMEIVLNSNVSPSSNSNGSTEVSYVDCTQPEFSYRPSENYTPENMMTKMIEMNLMAERARKLVQENDRLARMVSQGSN